MTTETTANHCFVCGPNNPFGLNVSFAIRDDICFGYFTPGKNHAGFDNVTHGGIIFSLLDDVMANWMWLQKKQCFTAKAEIRYLQKSPLGVELRLEGRCQTRKGRLVKMSGIAIRTDNEEKVASASGSFMLSSS
tara:strand:- start:193 stop:594 length:402 start_codon:yes stop_codon:yes gene_type:complete